jgi:hypothetical protein
MPPASFTDSRVRLVLSVSRKRFAYDRDTNRDSDYCKLAKANRVQYESFGAPATAREAVGEC